MSVENIANDLESSNESLGLGKVKEMIGIFGKKVLNLITFKNYLSPEKLNGLKEEIKGQIESGISMGTIKRTMKARYGEDVFDKIGKEEVYKFERMAIQRVIEGIKEKPFNETFMKHCINYVDEFSFKELFVIDINNKTRLLGEFKNEIKAYGISQLETISTEQVINEGYFFIPALYYFFKTFLIKESQTIRNNLREGLTRIITDYRNTQTSKTDDQIIQEVTKYLEVLGFKPKKTKKNS